MTPEIDISVSKLLDFENFANFLRVLVSVSENSEKKVSVSENLVSEKSLGIGFSQNVGILVIHWLTPYSTVCLGQSNQVVATATVFFTFKTKNGNRRAILCMGGFPQFRQGSGTVKKVVLRGQVRRLFPKSMILGTYGVIWGVLGTFWTDFRHIHYSSSKKKVKFRFSPK